MKFPSIFSLGCLTGIVFSSDMWIAVTYLWVINLLTLLAFGWDKLRAKRRKTRVPEAKLLWLAVIGGAPGAVLGRWIFQHKTRKRRFSMYLYLVLGLQGAVLYFLATHFPP
ncbi:DUF1294 domain-containing protein [Ruegeria sp. HKCCD7221]|uniref:DUF1294 domain-containing protein n=1 Tax=unclassified Ruegeria TaxID=2625375 RepID=UPI00353051D7